jgi:hypothetical protein
MNLLNFLVWLCAGAVIGWFARQMVEAEHRRIHEHMPDKDSSSEKS